MITCSNTSLAYEDRLVVENFSASFAPGTITAIVGANGTGKSTLLAAIAGDIKATTGEISVNGRPIEELSLNQLSQLRSLAQQSHSYWMAYRAEEILRLGNSDVSEQRMNHLIERLAMQSYLHQSVTTLSGGQLQRIEIARALARELPMILLDEPFASQDLTSISAITELLIEERAAGRTVVLVAHARREDLVWCDQIIELPAR